MDEIEERLHSYIVEVVIKKKKSNRIIKATSQLDARFKMYSQLLKVEKIKDFEIKEVRKKGEQQ